MSGIDELIWEHVCLKMVEQSLNYLSLSTYPDGFSSPVILKSRRAQPQKLLNNVTSVIPIRNKSPLFYVFNITNARIHFLKVQK